MNELSSQVLHADRDVCIGAGMCARSAADLFDQDDAGLVVIRHRGGLGADAETAARRAAAACPAGAIGIRGVSAPPTTPI